jgi:cytochrome b subunit of formate dehydrogenase
MLIVAGQRDRRFGDRRIVLVLFILLLFGLSRFAHASEESEMESDFEDSEEEIEQLEDSEQEIEAESCQDCHDGSAEGAPVVLFEMLSRSVHEDFECEDCHEDAEAETHEGELESVDCSTCHDEEAEVYVKHGRLIVGVDPDIPGCASCHGTHEILEPTHEDSRANPLNLPETCGSCHENYDLTLNHKFLPKHPVETYRESVHGKTTNGGRHNAATCNDCHSTDGTAHRILSPGDPLSTTNHFVIPKTCGKCHGSIEKDYWEGIHGQLTERGKTDSPVCTHCHGEHQIISPDDPRSAVSHSKVAEATCAPCHESASLNEKYGVGAGHLVSFVDSYHGLKSTAGDMTVANCASCHGSHRVLPHTDEGSSIHASNLQETCGNCHPGISKELAQSKIHAIEGSRLGGWPDFFAAIYMTMIAVTVAGMLAYIGLDYRRQLKAVFRGEQVRRMTKWENAQHAMLLLAFVVLVVTGFALRFSDSWWSVLLFGREGGFPLRNLIHRYAAVTLILVSLAHVFYLRGTRGREFMRAIFPSLNDLIQLREMLSYNLGFSNQRPNFGRFSFVEKFEYWALIWGTIIMAVTGTCLWFENDVVKVLPKVVLDVMLVIHYYEAWLATLSILIWHLYSTVFSPAVYPMNPAWVSGKMPVEQFRHEHPGAAIEGPETEEVEAP